MQTNLYDVSIPMFVRMLGNLSTFLDKADEHATAKGFDSANFLGMRLAPDMLAFARQVQIACDTAKFCGSRLAGIDAPKHEDNETTTAQLKQRIASTIDFLRTVPADKMNAAHDREISWARRSGTNTARGGAYVIEYAIPNFYFHVTTAYALLRHGGVTLGKQDFLNGFNK